MEKTNKILNNSEILNILGWINREKKSENGDIQKPTIDEVISLLSIKGQWAFRKNLKILASLQEECLEMFKEIEAEYSSDDKSHNVPLKDRDGNVMLDKDGNEINNKVVNDEYVKEFTDKKKELLSQENEVSISTITIEEVPEGIGFENLNMLSFMIEDDD